LPPTDVGSSTTKVCFWFIRMVFWYGDALLEDSAVVTTTSCCFFVVARYL